MAIEGKRQPTVKVPFSFYLRSYLCNKIYTGLTATDTCRDGLNIEKSWCILKKYQCYKALGF